MGVYDATNEGAFPFRLREVERSVRDLLTWRSTVDTTMASRAERDRNMDEKVESLTRSVDSLRRVILGFALSVAGSAVVFAFSILVATGKIGG